MSIIDLRSDTVTKPTPEMREAMMRAEVGDDVFGEDPTVNELQAVVAQMFDKEDALFVTSGTMGNQLAVKTHTQPGNELICEADAHIFKYEAGGAGMLSGAHMHIVHGVNGILSAEQVQRAINRRDDIHCAPTALIALENTHNRAGGTIFPMSEIQNIRKVALENHIPMHLDGARLMNACVATNIKPVEYGKYFDSISLCFSKGLGAPVGSVLVGTKAFIAKARYYRKMFGGGMRQAGFLAAAALFALRNNINRLKEDHQKAEKLARTIGTMNDFCIDIETVQTNIVIFAVKTGSSEEVIKKLESLGILSIPFSNKKIRFVTHLDVSHEQIDYAIECLKNNFK